MPTGARWRALRLAVGAILAVLAGYVLLAKVGWGELVAAIPQARAGWTAAALATVFSTLALVTVRWGVLLAGDHPPSALGGAARWRSYWDAVVIGQAANIILPLRFGEGARVAVTCAELRRPPGGVTVALAFERALDVAAIGAVVLVVVAGGWLPHVFDAALPTVGALVVVTVAGVLLFVRLFPAVLQRVLRRIGEASRVGRWLAAQEASARAGWAAIAHGSRLILLGVLTALIMLSSASTNLLIFRAFDVPVPPIAALVLLAVLQVGTTVVSVPGNVGVFHYLTVVTLAAWQVPAPVALAAGVVLHLVSLGPRVLLGSAATASLRLRGTAVPGLAPHPDATQPAGGERRPLG